MSVQILTGNNLDILPTLPAKSVHCCVTSPPYYGLRDYGHAGQIGLEETPAAFVAALVKVFAEVHRVLRDDGTLWLNLGDSYAGSNGNGTIAQTNVNLTADKFTSFKNVTSNIEGLRPKNLIGIPWRVAFALQDFGWCLRSDIIWSKPSCMPESVTDRPTKSHEYIFLLSKSAKYHYDADAIREPNVSEAQAAHNQKYAKCYDVFDERADKTGQPGNVNNVGIHSRPGRDGRNKRSVWHVATAPYSGAHFATFPPKLIEPCILAGCPENGVVLDPFGGAATTGLVADRLNRNAILIELNPTYAKMGADRIEDDAGLFADVSK